MNRPTAYRLTCFLVLIALAGVMAFLLFATPYGKQLRDREYVHGFAHAHPFLAPASIILAYVVLSVSLMPVWFVQIIAGYVFGPVYGAILCLGGATLAATLTHRFSNWLIGEWFHKKFEARRNKLRHLDERLGHNGLLVVMATRLTHLIPFGISNYLFGMTTISSVDVFLGTLLGNIPVVVICVTIGNNPHAFTDWRFITLIASINVLLLIPLALRYWKPEWFKKIGVD